MRKDTINNSFTTFLSWIEDIASPEQVNIIENLPHILKLEMYTNDFIYTITAQQPVGNSKGFLSCCAKCRKIIAGEKHARGNDLIISDFTQKTWDEIKNIIIRYELVNICKE